MITFPRIGLATLTFLVASVIVACSTDASRLKLDVPMLSFPARAEDFPGGSAVAEDIDSLDFMAREERLIFEISRGNVPSWYRVLKPVQVSSVVNGIKHKATFWVAPDYLAVGSADDYFLTPLSPRSAQKIADLVGASLPTVRMVDAIWAAADVRLAPRPIPPSPEMTTVAVFLMHNQLVIGQRQLQDVPEGSLFAGHKKDVVISSKLENNPGKVALYGWHDLNGQSIQPLYTGHSEAWVDYSHGIRLVARYVVVDGAATDLWRVFGDEELAPLLSAEGTLSIFAPYQDL